jgi:uncharacterized membrane protein
MCGSSQVRAFLITLLVLLAVPALASESAQDLGAHRFGSMDEFQRVIDERCTVCHTRERVDVAIRMRQDMEKLQQQMEVRGAVLSERDKSVLGTFWGSPLKEREAPATGR